MKYYFAPMEGITGYIYRNAHSMYFKGVDKYFSPFISTTQKESIKSKELKDILPENNVGINLVPQILSNNAKDFVRLAKFIKELGYKEINLNLGCPSATVVSKNKGSGFLAQPQLLDNFLEEIYESDIMDISVKTRIGKESADEFSELLEIYNKYPIEELIIHPRIRTDFYKNKPNLEVFKYAMENSKNPVVYNGDIFSVSDYQMLSEKFPELSTVMLGRGLIKNPALIGEIKSEYKMDKEIFSAFHDKIFNDYRRELSGDMPVLFKMKEIWSYMISLLDESKKIEKKIKKANNVEDYGNAVKEAYKILFF